MTEAEALDTIINLPVHRDDQHMVSAAMSTGDWDQVETYLAFRLDSGKNLDRTILLARAWYWKRHPMLRHHPLMAKIIAAVQQRRRMKVHAC